MDRRDELHRGARVELPASVRRPDASAGFGFAIRPGRVSPKYGALLALVSFLGCGVAVIATASMLALYVR